MAPRAVPDEAAATWRVALQTSPTASAAIEGALDAFCDAVSVFEIEEGRLWSVEGVARRRPDEAAVTAAVALAAVSAGEAPPDLTIERVPATDWLAATYTAFPPFAVGPFVIHGSHVADAVPPGKLGLLIDAATAFGSGEHPTTEGCLLAIDRLARSGRRPRRVLDMGCGTGILAFAAAKAFGAPVLACDIDPESVRVTRVNARMNRLSRRVRALVSDGYRRREVADGGPYDLILANILARPLAAMAADLKRNLAPGGVAILAGLLARQERQVLAAHHLQGLRLVHRIPVRGWPTLIVAG
jgi:ribosomal protein L11 methyltransferase